MDKMILLALFSALLTSLINAQKQECGRSCLMPCRLIAIRCVQDGIKPQEFPRLMGCVYDKAQLEEFKTERYNGVDCLACIEDELKERSFEDEQQCNGLERSQNCGWIAGKCYMKKDDLDYSGYEKIVEGVGSDEKVCGMLGGRFRNDQCVAKPSKKVRCGHINKKKHHGEQVCDSCMHLCNWMPGCQFKTRKNRCSGKEQPYAS